MALPRVVGLALWGSTAPWRRDLGRAVLSRCIFLFIFIFFVIILMFLFIVALFVFIFMLFIFMCLWTSTCVHTPVCTYVVCTHEVYTHVYIYMNLCFITHIVHNILYYYMLRHNTLYMYTHVLILCVI